MARRYLGLLLFWCVTAGSRAAAQHPLRVLEFRPGASAAPGDVFTITFDRPVAGMIEQTFDPARVVTIVPDIPLRVEWRDPATIRVAPLTLLSAGREYVLQVDTTFAAVDGARLDAPAQFRIRVHGPRLMASIPRFVAARDAPTLTPDGQLRFAYSAPIDSAAFGRVVRVEITRDGDCSAAAIPFRVISQRLPTDADYWVPRSYPRDSVRDRFLRVVEMRPEVPLPDGCTGEISLPSLDSLDARVVRYPIHTAAPFQLAPIACLGFDCVSGAGIALRFSALVRVDELRAHVHFEPSDAFTPSWPDGVAGGRSTPSVQYLTVVTRFEPRQSYRVLIDSTLRDVYDRPFAGARVVPIASGDRAAGAGHFAGMVTLPRDVAPVLRVRHVNVDTVELILTPVPDGKRAERLLGRADGRTARAPTIRRTVVLHAPFNEVRVTDVSLPELADRYHDGLLGVQVRVRHLMTLGGRLAQAAAAGIVKGQDTVPTPMALFQRSNLAVHAVVGESEGAVFVTDVRTGRPVQDAEARLMDRTGAIQASGTSDARGVAVLRPLRAGPVRTPDDPDGNPWAWQRRMEASRVVEVAARGDRVITSVGGDDDLGVAAAWSSYGSWVMSPSPSHAAVFTDRGIYRPGEPVFAAAVLRDGPLANLRAPERGTRVRWRVIGFTPEKGWSTVRETVRTLGAFGTATDSFQVMPDAALGGYQLQAAVRVGGGWETLGSASYRVAEYRAPEFLAKLVPDSGVRFLGDTARAALSARFLFDAPMPYARVRWRGTFTPLTAADVTIPNVPRGFSIGDQRPWWDPSAQQSARSVSGVDSLDIGGHLSLRIPTANIDMRTGARLRYEVAVEDVNRQTVTASATQLLHAASFYLALRDAGRTYWWNTGVPRRVEVLAVRPDGRRVAGVPVRVALVRHRYEEDQPGGRPTGRWRWIQDTVRIDSVVTADTAVGLDVRAPNGGYHTIVVTARDDARRPVRASLARYVLGGGGVRWGDSPTRLDLVVSTEEQRVGDTATVAFVSPFDSAEAWVTVERETVLWQRRMTVAAGPATVAIPITEPFVPNVFVSVLLVNHGNAARLDSLQQRMRRGSAAIRVDPAPKRLDVRVQPERAEYGPGDSAAVVVRVGDHAGRAVPGAVAVWAVDEGVLALTGYERPDPVAVIFHPVAPGLRHATTLTMLPTGDPTFLRRMIGYDVNGKPVVNLLSEVVTTGAAVASEARRLVDATSPDAAIEALRSDFRTTAFFRAFVRTGADGSARVAFRLPDNVTTFRVIAVAASQGDRFGSGESPLVSTKALVIRAALPRFVRPGDEFVAGGVVNARDGRISDIDVSASAAGMALVGDSTHHLALAASGSEARFHWRVPEGDSVRVRLAVRAAASRDAVSVRLAIRPDYTPRAHTLAGVVRDSARVQFVLPAGIDAGRSRLTIRVGSSPMPTIEMAGQYLTSYPYLCTEQLMSAGNYLVSQLELDAAGAAKARDAKGMRRQLQEVVDQLAKRQTAAGGFGYWSRDGWTTTWLSANTGLFLTAARDRGAHVGVDVFARLTKYLIDSLALMPVMPDTTYGTRTERWLTTSAQLSDRLATAQYLARVHDARGARAALELVPVAHRLWWEDRIWLAQLLYGVGHEREARTLLDSAWTRVTMAGARVDIPDSLVNTGLFPSRIRPAARLLSATLAIDPGNERTGALVERIVQRARSQSVWWWNTQDYAAAAHALSEFTMRLPARSVEVTVRSGLGEVRSNVLATVAASRRDARDTTVALSGLVEARGDSVWVPLTLTAANGPVYYALTVEEVPLERPTTPDVRGISVERWYERFDDGRPVTELREGELVRVRLRVTVPGDREFVALEDPLPAGLEAVDLSLRTSGTLGPFTTPASDSARRARDRQAMGPSLFGAWDNGWWTPWEHTEMRDDRVVYFARFLWRGTYTATYVARATTSGRFVRVPAHAEEMYNPALSGRSEGGWFRVVERR